MIVVALVYFMSECTNEELVVLFLYKKTELKIFVGTVPLAASTAE